MRAKPNRARFETMTFRLIESISVPVLLLNHLTGKVAGTNSAFTELTRIRKFQIKGKNFAQFFSPQCRDRVEALTDLMANSETKALEEHDCELLKRGDRRISVNIKASRFRLGNHSLVLVSIHDLTREKEVQKQRELSLQELSQVSKLADIGMLAAGVAHELNNPLMIVQGYAENVELLLERDLLDKSELHQQVHEILKATERMARLIAQMTRMVRSTTVKFELIDLRELVQGTLRFLNHEVKHTEVSVDLDLKEQIIARCDSGQVEQVLLNILSNAIHAVSKVDLPRKLRIAAKGNGEWTEITIWNNGPTIPDELKAKVMTPFFTTKEPGHGTGLGLPVSFGIMKAHEGTIAFHSEEGAGTEFVLRFPAVKMSNVPLKRGSQRVVVLVDTDQASLELLDEKVSSFGFKTAKFRSGNEALEFIQNHPEVVAVFTELRMPGMDGIELCRAIKSGSIPTAEVVAITSYRLSPWIEQEVKMAGMLGLLQKPINHSLFTDIFQKIHKKNPEDQSAA